MIEWIEKFMLYFSPTFWPWPIALLATLLVIVFSTASYWFLNTGGCWSRSEGLFRSKSKFLNYSLAFILPIMTGIGVLLTLVPIHVPYAIYLKSGSHPYSFDPTSKSRWDGELEEWKAQAKKAGLSPIDLQPYVDRALQYLNNNYANRAWDRENIGNAHIFIEAIEQSFSSEIEENPNLKPWIQHFPRWVIESIEISMLKAITLTKNVRAYTVEAHPRTTPSGHAWTGIDAYLSVPSLVTSPISAIHADATVQQIGDMPMIIGRPFVRIDSTTSSSIKLKPIIQVRWPSPEDKLKIEVYVNGKNMGHQYIYAKDITPPGEKIHVLEPFNVDEKPTDIKLIAKFQNYESNHSAFLIGEKARVALSLQGFDDQFKHTLELFSECSNSKTTNFTAYYHNSLEVSDFTFFNDGMRDVNIILTDDYGMWFFPEGIIEKNRKKFMNASKSAMRVVPKEAYENGIYLKATRSNLGTPGIFSLFKTPFLFDENQHFFVDIKTEALSYISGYRLPRWDYSRMDRNTVRPLLSKWTLRKEDGTPQSVYHLAVNPDRQGLYLKKDSNGMCLPTKPESYDSGRFFPVWFEILKAIKNTSVQPLSNLPVESQSRLMEPVFALDAQTQTRLRAEKILPGVAITLIGIILHFLIAVYGVLSVRKLVSDK
ncbi:hypothetical protein GCM10009092_43950 [Bowmanella denitrificans]|uniref:Aerotolerance regulator N-terminal domain-containing protein n=1 Tax=Bowmanella denitrificans TaxID=366582 RepID=A0ABN0XWK8_9ALTE